MTNGQGVGGLTDAQVLTKLRREVQLLWDEMESLSERLGQLGASRPELVRPEDEENIRRIKQRKNEYQDSL